MTVLTRDAPPPADSFLALIEAVVRDTLTEKLAAQADRLDPPQSSALGRDIAQALDKLMQGEAGTLLNELTGLSDIINRTRAEIADLTEDRDGAGHFRMAADELDAVIGATENATHGIMDACERIESLCGGAACGEAVVGEVTRIYEACSFQDITGQRLGKVVAAMQQIETRLHGMIEGVEQRSGLRSGGPDLHAPNYRSRIPAEETGLLNGPQLAGGGIDQTAVDQLFD